MEQYIKFAADNDITVVSLTQIPERMDGSDLNSKATHWHVVIENGKTGQIHTLQYSMGCSHVEKWGVFSAGKKGRGWGAIDPTQYIHPNWYKLKHRKDMDGLVNQNGHYAPRGPKHRNIYRYRWAHPKIEDILYGLQMDISGDLCDFEDWATDCGYDTDSRKAYALFETCQKTRKQMMVFIGKDHWERFQELTEE